MEEIILVNIKNYFFILIIITIFLKKYFPAQLGIATLENQNKFVLLMKDSLIKSIHCGSKNIHLYLYFSN